MLQILKKMNQSDRDKIATVLTLCQNLCPTMKTVFLLRPEKRHVNWRYTRFEKGPVLEFMIITQSEYDAQNFYSQWQDRCDTTALTSVDLIIASADEFVQEFNAHSAFADRVVEGVHLYDYESPEECKMRLQDLFDIHTLN